MGCFGFARFCSDENERALRGAGCAYSCFGSGELRAEDVLRASKIGLSRFGFRKKRGRSGNCPGKHFFRSRHISQTKAALIRAMATNAI